RVQHHDLSSFTRSIEKSIGVRFNLRFLQILFDLVAHLFERWNDAARKTRPEARRINLPVIVRNLLLAYYYEISKPKIQIFFHFESLLNDLVQFLTRHPDSLQALLKLKRRWKVARQLITSIGDFLL